jgi:uncharacterized protein
MQGCNCQYLKNNDAVDPTDSFSPGSSLAMGALRFASTDVMTDIPVQLYGYLTTPKTPDHHDYAVVLCSPFGQESVRTHRLFRVLADRLARIGVASLRFDYFGTGDSDGDDEYAPMSIQTCIKNLHDADLFLREQAKAEYVSWFGLRYGASIAALASSSTPLTPDRLILWDPIINGADWLTSLREDHIKALEMMMLQSELGSKNTNQVWGFESQGYRVTNELIQFMNDFTLDHYQKLSCSRLIALAAGQTQATLLRQLDNCRNISSFALTTVGEAHWNSDEAMNTAIVPQDVIHAVISEMSATGI